MNFIKEITCIQAVGTSDDEARKYGYESWIDLTYLQDSLLNVLAARSHLLITTLLLADMYLPNVEH